MAAPKSEFGITVLRLANEQRWVTSEKELLEVLHDGGYDFAQQTVNSYLRGKRRVDAPFVQALIEVLGLDEDQRIVLWKAWTYGQDRFPALS